MHSIRFAYIGGSTLSSWVGDSGIEGSHNQKTALRLGDVSTELNMTIVTISY